MMRRRLLNVVIVLICLLTTAVVGSERQFGNLSGKGNINFRDQLEADHKPVALVGEWEFYWNQLLKPGDFKNNAQPHLTGYFKLPGYWNGYKVDQTELGGKGFATFRIVVDNIVRNRIASISQPVVNSAYRLFINGSLISQCGSVGQFEEISEPQICPHIITFSSNEEQLEFIIQVSNFHFKDGGIPKSILLGDQKTIVSLVGKQLAFDLLIIGALLITGLYYFGISWVRRQDGFTFYFGFFCLFMSLRTSLLNTNFFARLFPDINWLVFLRIDFFSLAIVPVLFSLYLFHFYLKEFSQKVLFSILFAGSILAVFSLIFDSYWLSKMLIVFQILIAFTCLNSFYILLLAVIKKRNGALELLIGCLVLIITVLNDILNAQFLVSTTYMAGLGVVFFLVTQTFVFIKRFATALQKSQNLSADLKIEVKDQIAAIRGLLDSTGQGILSFDETFTIQRHASRATYSIFEKEVFGDNVLELMFPETKNDMSDYLEILFKSNGKMRLVKDMLPKEFEKNGRYYDLEFRWISAGKKTPCQVMAILTDTTTKRKLEKMVEKDEKRNQKIIRIAVDRHGFLRFYNNIQKRLSSIDLILKRTPDKIDPAEVSAHFHTIKGGLSGYMFFELAEIAHQAEGLLDKVMRNQENLSANHITKLFGFAEQLRIEFREEVYELGDLVPSQFFNISNKGFYTISEDKIAYLEQFLADKHPDDPELKEMLKEIKKQPLRNTIKKIASDAKYIAYQLKKQIEVKYSGEGTQIIHAPLETFLSSLTHLVRNSVHHGIEDPAERKRIGKPEIGTISIDITLENSIFKMVFADDGSGIDVEKLKSLAVERGSLNAAKAKAIDDKEALRLILLPGFTTQNELNNLSGRGIGMHAVSTSVNELGGTIDIKSKPGSGICFTIAIPVSF